MAQREIEEGMEGWHIRCIDIIQKATIGIAAAEAVGIETAVRRKSARTKGVRRQERAKWEAERMKSMLVSARRYQGGYVEIGTKVVVRPSDSTYVEKAKV